jgi:hypothetical protein
LALNHRLKLTNEDMLNHKVAIAITPSWNPLTCLTLLLWGGSMLGALAQNSAAEREAREIVDRIRFNQPTANSTAEGIFKIFHGRRLHATVPFRSEVGVTTTNWQVTYRTSATTNAPVEQLVITRTRKGDSTYTLSRGENPAAETSPGAVFGGSDYLAGDLGLEFLNWPGQRLLKKELRSSQSCYVIESTPGPTNALPYSRVVTWLDIDSVRDFGAPAIVHANAYDAQNRLLKEFAPKNFRKVDGQWQVEEVQLENVQTGNRTKIEFHLEPK